MYIELDHKLVPRSVEDINEKTELPGRVKERAHCFAPDKYLLNKYQVKQGNIQDIFIQFEQEKLVKKEELKKKEEKYRFLDSEPEKKRFKQSKDALKFDVNDCEPIVGPSEEVYFDEDLGFFSTILACYNNHWTLKTSPDDWWNVIVRVVAQAIEENGDEEPVRKMFVNHKAVSSSFALCLI